MGRWQSLFWIAGRLPRRPYWFAILSLIILSLGARMLTRQLDPSLGGPLYAVVEAGVAWIGICTFARRLHDLGRSGWWQVPAFVLTVAGFYLAQPALATTLRLSPTVQALCVMVGMAAYFGFIIALGIVRGMTADNRFGPAAAAPAPKPLV
jgi:uncharacterized membrane protein YhaH (DUF805 family)